MARSQKINKNKTGKGFWDSEYKSANYLKLSTEPAEDFVKFLKWIDRSKDFKLPAKPRILDVGCGNGRNLIYACELLTEGNGVGLDISQTAIDQAKKRSNESKLDIQYIQGDLHDAAEKLTDQENFDLIIDMMASHYITEPQAIKHFATLVWDKLEPGGWWLLKSFLKDGDRRVGELLSKHGHLHPNTYTHPKIGVPEHVWTEAAVLDLVQEQGFKVEKFLRSHKHVTKGKTNKRRTFTAYLWKPW